MPATPRSGTGTGVTYTGSNTAAATSSGNPFTLPAAATAGDLLVLALELGTNSAQTIGGLTGWTLLLGPANSTGATNPAYGVAYYRIMQAGDTAPTVTWTSSTRWRGLIQAFSGVDQATPFDGTLPFSMTAQSTSGTAGAIAASVTPSLTDDLLVFLTMFRNTTTATPTATPPAGMTETAENPAITTASGVNASMEMAHQQLASSAATGTRQATLSLSSQSVAGLFLIRAAPAAAAVSAPPLSAQAA